MSKKVLILCTTVCFILFTNLLLIKSSAHTKIHNNHLFFTGTRNVSFTVEQHCVSLGQPYATPDGSQAGSVKYFKMVGINIRAGRHGSDKTVNCTSVNLFDRYASFKDSFTFDPLIGKRKPKKFNFAVKGTLVIKGKFFDEIILAQGHSYICNNWWFGGNKCYRRTSNNSNQQVECTARDGTQWCFIRGFSYANESKTSPPDHVKVQTHRCVL